MYISDYDIKAIISGLIAYCQRNDLLSTNDQDLTEELYNITDVSRETIDYILEEV